MRFIRSLIVVLLFSITIASAEDDLAPEIDAVGQALLLLEQLEMDSLLQDTISQALDVQLQQNPSLLPYRSVLDKFFQKYMSYDSVKDELALMYAEAFTAQELKTWSEFYATPLGQKSIKLMPKLMTQGAQLGAQRVADNLAELDEMIAAEAQRLSLNSIEQR